MCDVRCGIYNYELNQ